MVGPLKINLRKAILTEVKLVKRRMLRRYRQRLCRRRERPHAALLTARLSPIGRVPSQRHSVQILLTESLILMLMRAHRKYPGGELRSAGFSGSVRNGSAL